MVVSDGRGHTQAHIHLERESYVKTNTQQCDVDHLVCEVLPGVLRITMTSWDRDEDCENHDNLCDNQAVLSQLQDYETPRYTDTPQVSRVTCL